MGFGRLVLQKSLQLTNRVGKPMALPGIGPFDAKIHDTPIEIVLVYTEPTTDLGGNGTLQPIRELHHEFSVCIASHSSLKLS